MVFISCELLFMGKNVEKRIVEEFLAKVCQGGRVTVPLTLRDKLDLKQGERIRVTIQRDEA